MFFVLVSVINFLSMQAEQIFKKICPGEEFLPRAPDPEEIVFEDDVTHGPAFRQEDGDEADGPKE